MLLLLPPPRRIDGSDVPVVYRLSTQPRRRPEQCRSRRSHRCSFIIFEAAAAAVAAKNGHMPPKSCRQHRSHVTPSVCYRQGAFDHAAEL